MLRKASRAQVVDEYGEVERKMLLWKPPAAPVNPHVARYVELQAEILSWQADLPADQGAIARGKAYLVQVSARGFKSIVTTAAKHLAFETIKAAGGDPFVHFDVTIADMRAQCGAEFVKTNIPKVQTGPRALTVVGTHAARKAA